MTEPSPYFQQFLDSFAVSDRQSAEDYDITALLALTGKEREQAEDILIERLLQIDDPRSPRALRYLHSEKAINSLQQALTLFNGEMLVETAFTLWELTKDQSLASKIIDVLQHGDLYARVSAANILRHFPVDIVETALFQAIDDPDKLVRANAVQSILEIHGLAPWETAAGRGISLLGLRLRSRFASIRQQAIAELHQIIAAKKQGKSAQEIGIPLTGVEKSANAKSFIRSFSSRSDQPPWTEDYDLTALTQLTGEEKEWSEYALLYNLEQNDFRAARALAHIGSQKAIAPLREILPQSHEPRLTLEVALGLWKLTGDATVAEYVEKVLANGNSEEKTHAAEILQQIRS
jgi:HEAT repeat protein